MNKNSDSKKAFENILDVLENSKKLPPAEFLKQVESVSGNLPASDASDKLKKDFSDAKKAPLSKSIQDLSVSGTPSDSISPFTSAVQFLTNSDSVIAHCAKMDSAKLSENPTSIQPVLSEMQDLCQRTSTLAPEQALSVSSQLTGVSLSVAHSDKQDQLVSGLKDFLPKDQQSGTHPTELASAVAHILNSAQKSAELKIEGFLEECKKPLQEKAKKLSDSDMSPIINGTDNVEPTETDTSAMEELLKSVGTDADPGKVLAKLSDAAVSVISSLEASAGHSDTLTRTAVDSIHGDQEMLHHLRDQLGKEISTADSDTNALIETAKQLESDTQSVRDSAKQLSEKMCDVYDSLKASRGQISPQVKQQLSEISQKLSELKQREKDLTSKLQKFSANAKKRQQDTEREIEVLNQEIDAQQEPLHEGLHEDEDDIIEAEITGDTDADEDGSEAVPSATESIKSSKSKLSGSLRPPSRIDKSKYNSIGSSSSSASKVKIPLRQASALMTPTGKATTITPTKSPSKLTLSGKKAFSTSSSNVLKKPKEPQTPTPKKKENTGPTIYKSIKGDAVDELLAKALNMSGGGYDFLHGNVQRLANGSYVFGTTKVFLRSVNGKLIARVGGGWIPLEEFLEKYRGQSAKVVQSAMALGEYKDFTGFVELGGPRRSASVTSTPSKGNLLTQSSSSNTPAKEKDTDQTPDEF
jgi:hypothetical protein